jgi:hypothetical protein
MSSPHLRPHDARLDAVCRTRTHERGARASTEGARGVGAETAERPSPERHASVLPMPVNGSGGVARQAYRCRPGSCAADPMSHPGTHPARAAHRQTRCARHCSRGTPLGSPRRVAPVAHRRRDIAQLCRPPSSRLTERAAPALDGSIADCLERDRSRFVAPLGHTAAALSRACQASDADRSRSDETDLRRHVTARASTARELPSRARTAAAVAPLGPRPGLTLKVTGRDAVSGASRARELSQSLGRPTAGGAYSPRPAGQLALLVWRS